MSVKKLSVILSCLFLLVVQGCNLEKEKPKEKMNDYGIITTLYSKILNEERNVWIYVPETDSSADIARLPVIYLLDPVDYFNSVVEMVNFFSEREPGAPFEKMIVVGIPNKDRIRDLTPSNDLKPSESSAVPLKDASYRKSGGAGRFTEFIEKELIPYIDSTFHPADFRILIGHSMGGLMSANAFLNYTHVFNGYMAIDPSIWWNHQEIIKQAGEMPVNKDFKEVAFFYANSRSAKDFSLTITDSKTRNPHTSELNFGRPFTAIKQDMPHFYWVHYANETHGSIPLIAIFDGLQIMSRFYSESVTEKNSNIHLPDDNSDKYPGVLSASADTGSVCVNDHFKNPGGINPALGHYDKNSNTFIICNDTLHTSSNLYNLMGDICLSHGEKIRAMDHFEKSSLFDPLNMIRKEKVRKLKSDLGVK